MDFSNFWWEAAGPGPGPQPDPNDPGDPIGQSLRFRGGGPDGSSNTMLERDGLACPTTFTQSVWLKVTTVPTYGRTSYMGNYNKTFILLQNGTDTSGYMSIRLNGSQNLVSSTDNLFLRDPGAWYHLVITSDATAGQSKAYLNGRQIGTTAGAGALWTGTKCVIGHMHQTNFQFEGYSAQHIFIDGQALQPTTFGRINDNGVWVPVDPELSTGSGVFFNGTPAEDPTISVVGGSPSNIYKEWDGAWQTSTWYVNGDAVNPSVIRVNLNATISDVTNIKFHGGDYNSNQPWKLKVDGVEVGSGTTIDGFAGEESVTFSARDVNYIELEATSVGVALGGVKLNDTLLVAPLSYGANGFHLTFEDPADLGKDYSGNDNHFTATGFDTSPPGNYNSGVSVVTGSFYTGSAAGDIDNLFNGDLSGVHPSNFRLTGTTDVWKFTPPTPIEVVNEVSIAAYGGHTYQVKVSVNGAETATSINANQPNGTIYNITTGPGTLNYIEYGGANYATCMGIGVDGRVFVNAIGTTYDLMQDSPTQNYATLNPLWTGDANISLEDANIKTNPSGNTSARTSITINFPESGKYYSEFQLGANTSSTVHYSIGVAKQVDPGVIYSDASQKVINFNSSTNNQIWENGSIRATVAGEAQVAGGAIKCAVDCDLGHVYIGYGSEWLTGSNTAVTDLPTSDPTYTIPPGDTKDWVIQPGGFGSTAHGYMNCGQRPFIYTPPAGFEHLQTKNLPTPTILNGRDHFQAITGGGQGLGTWSEPNTNSINSLVDINNATSGPFYTLPVTPASQRHWIHDFGFPQASVTHTHLATQAGLTYALSEDGINWTVVDTNFTVTANVEITSTAGENGGNNVRYVRLYHPTTIWGIGLSAASGGTPILQAAQATFPNGLWWIKDRVNSNQHQLVDSVRAGNIAVTSPSVAAEGAYASPAGNSVAWCWNAGGAAVTNNDGTLESQVSANTDAGFSIMTYTGNGTAGATFGHGLNDVPEFFLIKARETAHNWAVYHSGADATAPENYFLILNSSAAKAADAGRFNNTAPTNTVITVGSNVQVNNTGRGFVAYAWHSVPGYSAFGSYKGNGNVDGPFVYLGFKPAFLLVKNTAGSSNWMIFDSETGPANPLLTHLDPDQTSAEISSNELDFLSNGVKFRKGTAGSNAASKTYIYAAFAENPFQSPVTAR